MVFKDFINNNFLKIKISDHVPSPGDSFSSMAPSPIRPHLNHPEARAKAVSIMKT